MNLLYLIIGIIPIDPSKIQIMAFSCQLVILPIFHSGLFILLNFFRGINFIFDTMYLYSFKSKVLRVLFQLESLNSEHRN